MITPTICTIVASRNAQSSVSYAEANQEKLIQAQQIANTARTKPGQTSGWCPSASRWANCSLATPNATTKVRSYSTQAASPPGATHLDRGRTSLEGGAPASARKWSWPAAHLVRRGIVMIFT